MNREQVCAQDREGLATKDASDAELVERAKAGDAQAFEHLAVRYWDTICAWMVKRGFDAATAEDATQEAFSALHLRIDRIRQPSQVRFWLATTAKNAALKSAPRDVPTEDVTVDLDGTPGSWAGEGPAQIEATDLRRRLSKALELLPVRDRQAMRLRYFEENSPAETARLLGVSEVAERSITSRARRKYVALLERIPVLAPVPFLRDLARRLRPLALTMEPMGHAVIAASLAVLAIASSTASAPPRPGEDLSTRIQATVAGGSSEGPAPRGPKEMRVPGVATPVAGAMPGGPTVRSTVAEQADEVIAVEGLASLKHQDAPPPDPAISVETPVTDGPVATVYYPRELEDLDLPNFP